MRESLSSLYIEEEAGLAMLASLASIASRASVANGQAGQSYQSGDLGSLGRLPRSPDWLFNQSAQSGQSCLLIIENREYRLSLSLSLSLPFIEKESASPSI